VGGLELPVQILRKDGDSEVLLVSYGFFDGSLKIVADGIKDYARTNRW
jgi:hypothetical protein